MWSGENKHATWLFTSRIHPRGQSLGVYNNFNLADHVLDEPRSVRANREILADELNVSAGSVIWPNLVHSTTALEITSSHQEVTAADILYTSSRSLVITTLSADCVPLIAYARNLPFALTAHIGWKGAATNIAFEIVNLLSQYTDNDVEIILGPSICGTCYVVEAERKSAVTEMLPASATLGNGVDLQAGLAEYFLDSGFQVTCIGVCTFESDSLFSYRRESVTGRQAAAVKLQ
ncbi:MAG: peptidoglycan editing factor PgeF [Actinomycetota bacterium]